jgi:N-acetylglucosamine repressor
MVANTKKGKNLEDIQQMNRALIISLLRKKEVISRADLAKATGLQQATITNIIKDLLEYGLVVETGIIDGEKGRRSIGLALNVDKYRVISVRLARKYFTIGLFDFAGNQYELISEHIDILSGPRNVLDRMFQSISNIMGTGEYGKVLGIGVAIPGPFFRSEGKIGLITEFPGWENISIKEELTSKFGLPTYVEHDANVGALAEWWVGSSFMDSGTMVYVAAGQGIGAGIINDGKLFTGALGVAGEIGHMSIFLDGPKCECNNRGCLELYCSTIALTKGIRKELDKYPHSVLDQDCTLSQIFEALESGDELATKVFQKTARYLGLGLVNIIYAYNPHVIIIGDELAEAGQRLVEIIRDIIKDHTLPSIYENLTIKLSSFKTDPVLIGAGSLVFDHIGSILPLFKDEN